GPPLEYLAADDFRRVDATRLPLRSLAERAGAARASAAAGNDASLVELEGLLRSADAAAPADRAALLRRAYTLLPGLRGGAARPVDYAATAAGVVDAPV